MITFRDWMPQAACRSRYVDADLFHPADNEAVKAKEARERKAQAVCKPCPVRTECLIYSIGPPGGSPEKGIWGGLNEDQRRAFKKNRARREAA